MGVDDVLAYIDQFGADGVPALVLVDELLVFQRDSDFMKGYFDLSWTPTNTAIALLDAWVARAPLLTKVDKPTLIVASSHGRELHLRNHKEMQRRIRGSRFEFFEDASHALFVDDPDRFNALLNGFFGRANR